MSDFEKCKEKLKILEIARRNSYRKVEIKKINIIDENSKNDKSNNIDINNINNDNNSNKNNINNGSNNDNSNNNNSNKNNINNGNNNDNNNNNKKINNTDDNSNMIKNNNKINVKDINSYDISTIVTPTRPKLGNRMSPSPSVFNQNTEMDKLNPSLPKTRFHNRSEKTELTVFHKKEIEYLAQKGVRCYYFPVKYIFNYFYYFISYFSPQLIFYFYFYFIFSFIFILRIIEYFGIG